MNKEKIQNRIKEIEKWFIDNKKLMDLWNNFETEKIPTTKRIFIGRIIDELNILRILLEYVL